MNTANGEFPNWYFIGSAVWIIYVAIGIGYFSKKKPDMDKSIWVPITFIGTLLWPLAAAGIVLFCLSKFGEWVAKGKS